MSGNLQVLIATSHDEAEEYKKAYPDLLVNALVYLERNRDWEGRIVTRCFVTETVDPDSDVCHYMSNALTFTDHGDLFPIFLRYDWRRYGWDYRVLLKKYMLWTHEQGEVVWEPGELEELKRLGAE